MSNTRDTGFLRNAIQVTDQGVTFVSGSTTLMSISSSGAVTTTGVISGSNALSASFSLNSALLNGTGSVGFATTGALLEVSSSQQQISSSQQQISASLLNVVANYATTGSNSFRANQSITGSLVVSSTITAQTLVVQTVTSSIVYSSGSNLFGSALGDTQTFTGSLQVTGSMSVTGSAAFSSDVILPYSKALAFNSISNQYITADSSNLYLGAANLARLTISSSGFVGIGTTSPQASLDIAGKANTTALTIGASNGYEIFITGSDSANIYHASPNQAIYLNTNGGFLHLGTSAASTLLTISGSSVGIGTTNPARTFHVMGQAAFDMTATGVVIQEGDGVAQIVSYKQTGATYSDLHLRGANLGIAISGSNGNVGIGTASPSSKLEVYGGDLKISKGYSFGWRYSDVNSNMYNYIYNSYDDTTIGLAYRSGGWTSSQTVTSHNFQTYTSSTWVSRLVILQNGNVGIGTTDPSTLLHILGSSANLIIADNTSYATGVGGKLSLHGNYRSVGDITEGGYIKTSKTNATNGDYGFDMIFATSNYTAGVAERMRISSGGNVGIGTTSPTATLQVRGPNAVGTFFDAQNVGAGGAVFSRINASSSPYNQYLFNNGNVGIDRTPLAKLAVYGGAVQIMGDYPHWQTIIKSAGANGTFSGGLTITIPEMSTASVDGYGGYSCEVYVAGYQGLYCHAWFSGYINGGIVVSETTILRSSADWSISQAAYGTYSQGFTFVLNYPSSIIHPTARIIFNKGGSPNSAEYPANSITAVFS